MNRLNNVKQNAQGKDLYTLNNEWFIAMVGRGTTKEEVAAETNTNERVARQMISELSMHYPVIANAGERGYRLARPIEEMNGQEALEELEAVNKTITDIEINNALLRGYLSLICQSL